MRSIIATIVLIYMFTSCVFSQVNKDQFGSICGTQVISGTQNDAPNIYPYFPVENDTLKILVVFCNFPNGNWDPPPPAVITQQWPGSQHLQKPTWADSIICPTTENVWENSLTAYFRDASMGQFWMIGDVYPDLYVFDHESSYYGSEGRSMGDATRELLEAVNVNVDFTQYDKFAPQDAGNKKHPDGVVDFIFIISRFLHSASIDPPSYTGIASLGGRQGNFAGDLFITLDGMKIEAGFPGSGAIFEMFFRGGYSVGCHEFGHYLFGSGHPVWPGFTSLMSGVFPHAYERETLNWGPDRIYVGSNSTITLRDYATTGDFVKFSRGSNTYYIQNFRRSCYHFTEQFNGWHWYPDDPILPYIKDSMVVISKPAWTVEHAFGRWDWEKDVQGNYLYDTFLDEFIIGSPNRTKGETIMDLIDKPCIDLSGMYEFIETHIGKDGDSNTCFDIGYNQVYSPWSNPGIRVKSAQDSLAIELVGRDENGDMIINFYFENLTETPPSKPTGIRIEEYYSDSTNSCHPIIIWEHNIEPDMMQPNNTKQYVVMRTEITGNPNQTYQYDTLTTLNINSDSTPYYIDYSKLGYCTNIDQPPSYTIYPVRYKVKAIDISEKSSIPSDYVEMEVMKGYGKDNPIGKNSNGVSITGFSLSNYPNPFNPTTTISYLIGKPGKVKLIVYDILGKEINTLINNEQKAGAYRVNFNGSSLPSGVYFYRLSMNGMGIETKRMLLIK